MRTFRWMGLAALSLLSSAVSAIAAPPPKDPYFTPTLSAGEHVADVYSVTFSIEAEGFKPLVGRSGGSSDYTAKTSDASGLTFAETDFNDGGAPSHGESSFRDRGATVCYNQKCRTDTDASGPVFNRILWGDPPARLAVGTSWTVRIAQPWELGPPGEETVTVVALDPKAGVAMLRRRGSGHGFAARDPAKMALSRGGQNVALTVAPGVTEWDGYTTFRHGVVLSDEIVAQRTDVLTDAAGATVKATRRSYAILDAAPFPSGRDAQTPAAR